MKFYQWEALTDKEGKSHRISGLYVGEGILKREYYGETQYGYWVTLYCPAFVHRKKCILEKHVWSPSHGYTWEEEYNKLYKCPDRFLKKFPSESEIEFVYLNDEDF